jgi:uncharacterized membrane protein YfcA
MDTLGYIAATAAAVAGGGINALGGGGTLVTFPVLLGLGVPSVAANMTNTVALSVGHVGGTWAQRDGLQGQGTRLPKLLVAGAIGGLAGAILLKYTSDDRLRQLIPVLLGLATVLLALQPKLRTWLGRHAAAADRPDAAWLVPAVAMGAVYGGYFGAGLGVMMLAMLGLGVHEPLNRSNVLKQLLAFVINFVAAVFFVFTGKVWWLLAGLMAVGSLLGGVLGGRVAGRLPPERFRIVVVAVGAAVTIAYAVKVWF